MARRTKPVKSLDWLKLLIFSLALLPLTRLLLRAWHDNLGANPIEKITHNTGFWALSFLLLTLTTTPLRRLTRWQWPGRMRRMLGLFAFFYASLHFATYLVLDQFFDWSAIAADIIKRPYITIGFGAFVLLIPLAITSNTALIRRLGGQRWRWLHRLIYPISIAGVIHFIWLVKKDISEPLVFAGLLTMLLGMRVWYWRRGLVKA
ncbi:sulfoxide reductase heme-binding subunit YedZ [Methylomonas paludis]|uniref:Protein-methionine-sulfoxide reductase heme-binding subunit MsrQ n=1 Tax=Methylomonas paludis TaxID=1173101 RepID=A0A975RAP4_9GAMM|nr:protein-methionine-sulfoxide reductase heme-binding subunit MsrQ [Methylomonas paludis]QWF71509.1 sulfoxide reductase heme-binding subunit YedZ [Methylomonas paludis]